eukprot:scaffold5.g639.t1
MAADQGCTDAVRLVLAAAPETALATDMDGWFSLHMAAWPVDGPGLFERSDHLAVIELLLAAAPWSQHTRTHDGHTALQLAGSKAHLSSSRLLLERSVAPAAELIDDLLDAAADPGAVTACRETVHALLADLAASRALLPADWAALPSPCPGLSRALPSVLARSTAEAAQLVTHLPDVAHGHLRTLALSLARMQRRLGLELPEGVVRRILAAAPVEEELSGWEQIDENLDFQA